MSGRPVDTYASLAGVLEALGSGADPAECHGNLCGHLLGVARGEEARLGPDEVQGWVGEVLEQCGAPGGGEPQGQADALRAAWAATVQALASPSLEFTPWLPDDQAPIGVRSRGLGRWCSGFLSGLGAGGRLPSESLPPEVGEVLRDFAEIARIEPSPAAGPESEAALTELTEFVKVSVLLVRESLRAAGAGQIGDADAPAPPTVH